MNLRTVAAFVGLLSTTPVMSAVTHLGLLDTAKPLYHSFADFTGSFADIYTFTLPGTSNNLNGDTTTVNFGSLWNVDLTSAKLSGTGLAVSQVDNNPNDGFSFSGLTGGGSYSLTIAGAVTGIGLNGVNGIYAGYVSAVPEPEALGLALAGLLITGAALRRGRG